MCACLHSAHGMTWHGMARHHITLFRFRFYSNFYTPLHPFPYAPHRNSLIWREKHFCIYVSEYALRSASPQRTNEPMNVKKRRNWRSCAGSISFAKRQNIAFRVCYSTWTWLAVGTRLTLIREISFGIYICPPYQRRTTTSAHLVPLRGYNYARCLSKEADEEKKNLFINSDECRNAHFWIFCSAPEPSILLLILVEVE